MNKYKNSIVAMVILLLAVLVVAGWTPNVRAEEANQPCPAGYYSAALLEPIKEGENNSKVISETCMESNESVSVQMLDPVDPASYESQDLSKIVTEKNETVMGPSVADGFRCVALLEPIAEGATESKIVAEVCSDQTISSIGGVDLNSAYLIAKFYDRTDYRSMLKEYYGAIPCSSGVSYGKNDLADDGFDNRYESGSAFSSCDIIEVFDFINHTGATYACGANCSSFYALNNAVTSWRVKD